MGLRFFREALCERVGVAFAVELAGLDGREEDRDVGDFVVGFVDVLVFGADQELTGFGPREWFL